MCAPAVTGARGRASWRAEATPLGGSDGLIAAAPSSEHTRADMQAAGAVSARGVNYDVSLSCDGEMLHLTLWQRDADRKWIGSFNTRCARRPAKRPAYILHRHLARVADVEEITHKTGSFKKFDVFVKMLHAALLADEQDVHLDVLTYADLHALKNHKAGNLHGDDAREPQPFCAPANDKRYLILTYASKFDRRATAPFPPTLCATALTPHALLVGFTSRCHCPPRTPQRSTLGWRGRNLRRQRSAPTTYPYPSSSCSADARHWHATRCAARPHCSRPERLGHPPAQSRRRSCRPRMSNCSARRRASCPRCADSATRTRRSCKSTRTR